MREDSYETNADRELLAAKGSVPIGIGKNTRIKRAIIDKNARIGDNVKTFGDITNSIGLFPEPTGASSVGYQDSLGAWGGDVWLGEVLSSSPTRDFYPFRRNRRKYRRVHGTAYCPIGCHCWT
nr:glucose-1-phosphate adenylyltransferase small subunit, chloroplastic/amyloplastic [Tanacetum cinerariifolium]